MKNGGIAVAAIVVAIPLLLYLLLATAFQDEQDRAAAQGTDCARQDIRASGGDRIAPAGSFVKPVDPAAVTFTSGFGARWGEQHTGIDLAGPMGTPIYAFADGVVSRAGPVGGFGLWVVLDHSIGGELVTTVYGHMDSFSVTAGETVRAGQEIAKMGSRGVSTGPHLHFEIWNGGYGGEVIDPYPLYDAAPAPGEVPGRPSPQTDAPVPVAAVTPGADLSAPIPASAGSEANMQVNSKRLMRALHARFGDRIGQLGGWRPSDPYPDHPSGQAVDVMIPDYTSGAGVAVGDEVADYILSNAEFFHVDYIIWRQMYIKPGQAPSKMEDRFSDTQNHYDHVHVTVYGGGYDDSAVQWGPAPRGSGAYTPGDRPDCVVSGDGLGDHLDKRSVPGEFQPWLERAGAMCPQIRPSLLAAQIHAESQFSTTAVSPAGAQGPAQFMPGTWPGYGRDDDGNGQVSPFDIGDAVMAQGRFMCEIATTIDAAVADGRVAAPNGVTELYLAAYNAGPGAVLSAGGFPSGGEYTSQTRPYADKIIASEPGYRGGQ